MVKKCDNKSIVVSGSMGKIVCNSKYIVVC